MKMKEQHIVPLSRQAIEILPRDPSPDWLIPLRFPGARTNGRPASENTVNASLRRLGFTKEEMTGHGFRSMASTILNEQGWPGDAIERQLAHGERDKVRGAYNFAEHLPERRRMMQAWSDYLDSLTRGQEIMKKKHRQIRKRLVEEFNAAISDPQHPEHNSSKKAFLEVVEVFNSPQMQKAAALWEKADKEAAALIEFFDNTARRHRGISGDAVRQ